MNKKEKVLILKGPEEQVSLLKEMFTRLGLKVAETHMITPAAGYRMVPVDEGNLTQIIVALIGVGGVVFTRLLDFIEKNSDKKKKEEGVKSNHLKLNVTKKSIEIECDNIPKEDLKELIGKLETFIKKKE